MDMTSGPPSSKGINNGAPVVHVNRVFAWGIQAHTHVRVWHGMVPHPVHTKDCVVMPELVFAGLRSGAARYPHTPPLKGLLSKWR